MPSAKSVSDAPEAATIAVLMPRPIEPPAIWNM